MRQAGELGGLGVRSRLGTCAALCRDSFGGLEEDCHWQRYYETTARPAESLCAYKPRFWCLFGQLLWIDFCFLAG